MALTAKQINDLWTRRKAGEATLALATEAGIERGQLLRSWRQMGHDPSALPSSLRNEGTDWDLAKRAYALHNTDGLSWKDTAAALGWTGTTKALTSRVRHYAILSGITWIKIGEVAKALGMPEKQARRLLRKVGVESKGEAEVYVWPEVEAAKNREWKR